MIRMEKLRNIYKNINIFTKHINHSLINILSVGKE